MSAQQASGLTTTDLLAAATEVLSAGAYKRIVDQDWEATVGSSARVFEDPYGIVAVFTYETWVDLSTRWSDAQASLVALISRHISRSEPKAWDGYLVLLTISPAAGDAREELVDIRYDTSRVRKLVATGDDLRGPSDIRTLLLPLLPLGPTDMPTQETSLDALPRLLASKGIPEQATAAVVGAFLDHKSLMEQLHSTRVEA